MDKKKILFIAATIIAFVFAHHGGYLEGTNHGFIQGMQAQREFMETKIYNGATPNVLCMNYEGSITCKVVSWNIPQDPKNATELKQRYGLENTNISKWTWVKQKE